MWWKFQEEAQLKVERYYRIHRANFKDFLRKQADLVRYDDGMIADYYLAFAGVGL